MLDRIIQLSLQYRWLVIALTLILVASGAYSLRRLDIDAFPDTTPVMVQINTAAAALGPLEIEQQISVPIEQAISGLPALVEVRSLSKFGFSQVTVIFADGMDVYFARQLVSERLQAVDLPDGIDRPEMGPVATGLGEIYHYLVTSTGSPTRSLEELTTIHDWQIKPQLRSVPGVAEVNTWGGEIRQYQVVVDPARLLQRQLTIDDLAEALRANNMNVGGGTIVQAGELNIVQGVSLTADVEQIANIAIRTHQGVPVRIGDVATVQIGHEIRRGAATAAGQGEVVLGLAFMLMGQNSHDVASRLDERMTEIRRSLPPGVEVHPVYKRTELVDQVIATVKENLLLGALLVIAVLFAFLGNLRAGILVALAIPLSMLFAANFMLQVGIAASLMSLGAIDFGLVVDSSVIMVENSVRRLGLEGSTRSRFDIVRDASLEVRRPTMFGELIIMIVYLPILTLEGIEGKMFRPMALTVIFALIGSMILSLTFMPAVASLILPARAGQHRENIIVRAAQWLYRPVVRFAIQSRRVVIAFAILLVAIGGFLASRLGSEFIPRLSEGAISINLVRLAGVSLEESVRYGTELEKLMLEKFPDEIREVWTRVGTAEIATDPMGIELSDMFITLRPREQWKRASTQDELSAQIAEELQSMPGMRVVLSQPIEMRMNEMIAGVRSDLGIKIFGDDLDVLRDKASQVQQILESVEGAGDIYVEQLTGQPLIEVIVNQQEIARFGIPAEHVLEMVEAIGGIRTGQVRQGQRRFDLVIRLPDRFRNDISALSTIMIPTAGGERIPLTRVADIRETQGPSTITHEWHKRRIVVQCNVRGRDLGGFVAEVRKRIAAELELPADYHTSFGGQFEHLERARTRLMLIVPLALLLILMLLYLSVHSLTDALIIFTGAPFAALGGIVTLWIFDMPFTISAGIGFVAVAGVSMLNGLVLVSTINQRVSQGVPLDEAIEQTRLLRLRPILMTALVASLGFVPMALNTHIGAEVQRPLAMVVIAGVIADNLLTLLVLPALLMTFKRTGAATA